MDKEITICIIKTCIATLIKYIYNEDNFFIISDMLSLYFSAFSSEEVLHLKVVREYCIGIPNAVSDILLCM